MKKKPFNALEALLGESRQQAEMIAGLRCHQPLPRTFQTAYLPSCEPAEGMIAMLDRQQTVDALDELLAAFRCLEGLGGAALRARRGLETDEDRDALDDWEPDELAEVRREAQAQLEELLDDEVRSGLEDLLFRVSAVTGLPPDEVRVLRRLVNDYGVEQVELVRPLLREVARQVRPGGFEFLLQGLGAVDDSRAFWRPYDHWNTALAETVFNREHAGRSVYLDIEPEVLDHAAEAIWPPIRAAGAGVEVGFRRTVRRTCVGRHLNPYRVRQRSVDEGINFEPHADRVVSWHNERQGETTTSNEPPPSVAVLALCSLAAERMRADSDKAASNYYGRLAEVLEVNGDRANELGIKYRDHALRLWESLNIWLRDLHGRRGLPTAVSFGHNRYVSLPISQALIRAQERDRLLEFFALYQFNPGQQVARDDMEGMLGRWIPNSGASGLRDVWGRGQEMRRRIADVVCTELEHWTGESPSATVAGGQQRSLLLAATWFEEPEDEFAPFLCVRSMDSEGIIGEYRLADGTVVQAQRDADGLTSLRVGDGDLSSDVALVDAALKGGLHLEHKSRDATLSLSHQRVVVLLFDPLRQVYVQSARVELGRQMLLLVDSGLSTRVNQVLEQSAESGFKIVSPGIHGLSPRWSLFTNVSLRSFPSIEGEALQPLRPLSRTQVELDGGLQLTDSRWHSQAPPSVIAVNGSGRSFRVELHSQSNLDEEPLELGSYVGQAKIALADRMLADGDYRIVLTSDAGAEITSRALKLRSSKSAHLDPPTSAYEDLAHVATPALSPRSALSADLVNESDEGILRGAVIDQRTGLGAVPETRLRHELGEMEPFETIEAWVQRYTGSTREVDLEQAQTYLRLGFVEHENGELVRTKAGTLHMHKVLPRSRAGQRPATSSTNGSRDLGVDLDLILDALAVMEAGSWNAFRRLIDHSESERFIPHEALRTLRALAYLDVEVGQRNAAPQRWSLSPTALLAMPQGASAVLTGRRTLALLEQLHEVATSNDARIDYSAANGRPRRYQIEAEHRGVLQKIAEEIATPLVFDAPRRILERMPTIQDILNSQPELLVPDGCTYERFESGSNRWREVEASGERLAGGYQIRFPTGERRHAVWADGIWRECGNATAKYAGAAAVGEHIMSYDEEQQELTCLFGARPPGLFERALILCSGELPQTPGDHRAVYRNVPDNVHRWIAAKLGPAGWRR